MSSRHALKNAPEIPVTDETEAALYPFFADSNRSILILWVEGDHIRMGGEMPTGDVPEMAYFLKTDHVTISPSDEFESKVSGLRPLTLTVIVNVQPETCCGDRRTTAHCGGTTTSTRWWHRWN